MQIKYDENKYKNFNCFNSQISKPWMNKYGTEMVCISLPNYIKEALNIPTDTRAVFNVSKDRVYSSKFNKDMSYTRISLERDMNIYVSHKNENGDYTNSVKSVKGSELYDALRSKVAKSKSTHLIQEASGNKIVDEKIVQETIGSNGDIINTQIMESIEPADEDQTLQDVHNEIEKENEHIDETEELADRLSREFGLDEIDDIQF